MEWIWIQVHGVRGGLELGLKIGPVKTSTFFTWSPGHLDDLDLYYGHKAQEMILTDVSDTIHADLFALFALNIDILLSDVTKPEKSKILTLT